MNHCWTHAFSFSLPIQAKKKRKREKAVKMYIVCFHHHSPALQSVGQSHVMLRAPIQRCTSRREKRGQKRSISGSNERGLKRAKGNYLLFFLFIFSAVEMCQGYVSFFFFSVMTCVFFC